MACLAQESCPSQSSLCALVSSYLRGFLYQAFVLMTVAVAPSVAYVRVFCTHQLESVVTPCQFVLSLFVSGLLQFFVISPYLIEAVYFLFAELSLLNKDVLLLLIFLLFFASLVQTFFRRAYGKRFSRILTYSLLVPGFRRLFCQRGLPRQLACMTGRSGDGRNLH